MMVERVIATPAALELIAQLQAEHGELMFHQSGGCCDNSAANCYLPTDLGIGAHDVKLGEEGWGRVGSHEKNGKGPEDERW